MALVRYITAHSPGSNCLLQYKLRDAVHNKRRLGIIIGRFVEKDFLACAAFTEEFFPAAVMSAVNHAHGGIENVLT